MWIHLPFRVILRDFRVGTLLITFRVYQSFYFYPLCDLYSHSGSNPFSMSGYGLYGDRFFLGISIQFSVHKFLLMCTYFFGPFYWLTTRDNGF